MENACIIYISHKNSHIALARKLIIAQFLKVPVVYAGMRMARPSQKRWNRLDRTLWNEVT